MFKADFADGCIEAFASAAGCQQTVTFDRAAAKLPGMQFCPEPAARPDGQAIGASCRSLTAQT